MLGSFTQSWSSGKLEAVTAIVPSRLRAGLRVGADWFERRGLVRQGDHAGLVSSLGDLGLDAAQVHPDVRVFFERTRDLELSVAPSWRPRFLGRLLHFACGLVGQLRYPTREALVRTRVVAIDPARDGRTDVRGVVRTVDGGVMQVAAYATWDRHMSVAFPMPLGNLFGLLRAEPSEGGGVVLSSIGVWMVTPLGRIPLPFRERLALWPARTAPWTIEGEHEQRFFGARYVTHRYRMRPI